MAGIDNDALLHGIPGLRERLELFITPFFQDIMNSVHNFVEIEVGAQLAAANKSAGYQQPPGSVETLSHVRAGRRRSLSEEPQMRRASIFSRGRSSIASSGGNPRASLASTAEEPKLNCLSSSPLAGLADPRELREGSNVQVQDRSHSPRRHSEAPSEAENDADDDDEEDKSTPVCRHWKSKGWCRLSESCKFLHPEQRRGTGALPKKSSRSRREASASLDDEDQAAGAPGRLKPRRGIGRSRQRGGEMNVSPAQALAPGLISSKSDQH